MEVTLRQIAGNSNRHARGAVRLPTRIGMPGAQTLLANEIISVAKDDERLFAKPEIGDLHHFARKRPSK